MNLHSLLEHSRANGPGTRAVLWMQGCGLSCPGCFNPGLKDKKDGTWISTSKALNRVLSIKGITGVSISGGEPTEQLPALLWLLTQLKSKTDLSILLFSGRTIEQITAMHGGRELVSLLDVLIDGPFDLAETNPPGVWPSSAGQKIHLLSDRYTLMDFSLLPDMEVVITKEGEVMQTGLWGALPLNPVNYD